VRSANGTRYAITNTCAANVLGYAKPGLHAYGNPESAQRAIAVLAEFIGKSIEDTARAILDIATDKVIPVVDDLISEYKLDRDQAVLVGEGGGAAALIRTLPPVPAFVMKISKDAEVISSIGVALALVRDVVERVIPNAQPEDLKRIRREAFEPWSSSAPRPIMSKSRSRSIRTPTGSALPRWAPRRCAPAGAGMRSASPRPGNRSKGDGRQSGARRARRRHAAHARLPGRGRGAKLGNLQEAAQPGSGD